MFGLRWLEVFGAAILVVLAQPNGCLSQAVGHEQTQMMGRDIHSNA